MHHSEDEGLGSLLPRIKVKPPGPKSLKLDEELGRFEAKTASVIGSGETPVVWERARGANIVDVDGNVYVDLTSSFSAAVSGHCNPEIVEAVTSQIRTLMHSMGVLAPNPPRIRLIRKLVEITPPSLSRAISDTTGSQAVEFALKASRAYTNRHSIIGFHMGFHGKNTLGAMSLTSYKPYRRQFLPLLPRISWVPYGYCYRCAFERTYPECGIFCAEYLRYTITNPDTGIDDTAAVILEPAQGHGGNVVPPPEFIKTVRRICTENDVLMIHDEIITGFGRTGKLFAFEHYDIVPDLLCLGKGIASGFPISACVGREEVMNAVESHSHTSTHLGNPVSCVAALANIEYILKNKLPERSARLGEHFLKQLRDLHDEHRLIGDVRGQGLLIGVELVKDKKTKQPAPEETKQVIKNALERGIMISAGGTFRNAIRIEPPLVVTKEQIDHAVQVLDESLSATEKSL